MPIGIFIKYSVKVSFICLYCHVCQWHLDDMFCDILISDAISTSGFLAFYYHPHLSFATLPRSRFCPCARVSATVWESNEKGVWKERERDAYVVVIRYKQARTRNRITDFYVKLDIFIYILYFTNWNYNLNLPLFFSLSISLPREIRVVKIERWDRTLKTDSEQWTKVNPAKNTRNRSREGIYHRDERRERRRKRESSVKWLKFKSDRNARSRNWSFPLFEVVPYSFLLVRATQAGNAKKKCKTIVRRV